MYVHLSQPSLIKSFLFHYKSSVLKHLLFMFQQTQTSFPVQSTVPVHQACIKEFFKNLRAQTFFILFCLSVVSVSFWRCCCFLVNNVNEKCNLSN